MVDVEEHEIAIARYCKLLEQTLPLGRVKESSDAESGNKEIPLHESGDRGSEEGEG